jgi:hypothetical protein
VSLVYDVHPEFGYFCPAPRIRRELRVALFSILIGIVIGAAIVTVRASRAVETDGVSSNAHLKSSGPETLAVGVAGSGSNADSVKADPGEAIKPYPMRMVRVRPSRAASPLAGIALGHTAPAEARASAGPAANAEASASLAASTPSQSVAAAAEPTVPGTKKRPNGTHARRQQDDEDENARWQNRRWSNWGERAYAEDRYGRDGYRNWVYR